MTQSLQISAAAQQEIFGGRDRYGAGSAAEAEMTRANSSSRA